MPHTAHAASPHCLIFIVWDCLDGPCNQTPALSVGSFEPIHNMVLQNDMAQAILLFGDLSYADDYNGHSTGQRNGYQPRWDTWGQLMQPIISHLPFLSVMGKSPAFCLALVLRPAVFKCCLCKVCHCMAAVFLSSCHFFLSTFGDESATW